MNKLRSRETRLPKPDREVGLQQVPGFGFKAQG